VANFLLRGTDIKTGRVMFYTGKQGPEAFTMNRRLAKVYKRDDGDADLTCESLNKGRATHRMDFNVEPL